MSISVREVKGLYKGATNEPWLLESWTAKHGGSELVVVVRVMSFNSYTVAPGSGISSVILSKKRECRNPGIRELKLELVDIE